jgi:hypothetical protein
MIALVHGLCFACQVLYFARIDAADTPEPRCPSCGRPLSYLEPQLGLHVLWYAGEPMRPLHTLILSVMRGQGRAVIAARDVPPLSPPAQGVPG